MRKIFLLSLAVLAVTACERKTAADVYKGVQATRPAIDKNGNPIEGLAVDSLQFETEVRSVLPTQHPQYRLTPVFKVNYRYGDRSVGESQKLSNYSYSDSYYARHNNDNNWNGNIVAGFETIYGDEMVNVSLFNVEKQEQKLFFEKPVLIENVYYPSATRDTLQNKNVNRNFYMISCYDEDTDKDGYYTRVDLRRFYLYQLDGTRVKALIPKEYGVIGSDYDGVNDALYVYARLDSNKNGTIDPKEPKHIFLIDLKKPETTALLYK